MTAGLPPILHPGLRAQHDRDVSCERRLRLRVHVWNFQSRPLTHNATATARYVCRPRRRQHCPAARDRRARCARTTQPGQDCKFRISALGVTALGFRGSRAFGGANADTLQKQRHSSCRQRLAIGSFVVRLHRPLLTTWLPQLLQTLEISEAPPKPERSTAQPCTLNLINPEP